MPKLVFEKAYTDVIYQTSYNDFLKILDERMELEAELFARHHQILLGDPVRRNIPYSPTDDPLDQTRIRQHIYEL